MEKHSWGAWDSNPGLHDGRHRQIHWWMPAPSFPPLFDTWAAMMWIFLPKLPPGHTGHTFLLAPRVCFSF